MRACHLFIKLKEKRNDVNVCSVVNFNFVFNKTVYSFVRKA